MPAIRVENVTKRYGPTVALDEVSLDVHSGELFALLGPNGAGKTTLVHILCTIHGPDEGTATVAGFDTVRQPRLARQKIGVVFQEPSLDDRLTVYENLDFHGRIYGVAGAMRKRRIDEMLALVELEDRRENLVRTLSTGMKRRLEIARCLIHDPDILYLDEPTVGLDAQTRHRIWGYIRELQQDRNLTVLVTTHYIEEVEQCHRVCIVDAGKTLALGAPADLKARFGQEKLRIRLKDDADGAEILSRFDGSVLRGPDEVEIPVADENFVERFLSEYGQRLRAMSVESPSLEGVFLALTGRAIRDEAADPRQRLYAFGRRGGEHTG